MAMSLASLSKSILIVLEYQILATFSLLCKWYQFTKKLHKFHNFLWRIHYSLRLNQSNTSNAICNCRHAFIRFKRLSPNYERYLQLIKLEKFLIFQKLMQNYFRVRRRCIFMDCFKLSRFKFWEFNYNFQLKFSNYWSGRRFNSGSLLSLIGGIEIKVKR